MKRILFVLTIIFITHITIAQNVGIGTTTPNTSAQLDITSVSKGFLMPRMTSAQRTSIASPVAGLMVYDTDRKLFYQYDGSIWRLILNNDFWNRASATSNYIVNLGDSVGVGLTTPTERLDVNGNIRTRNNLIADAALVVGTTAFADGDITTNSDLVINNTTATLQLKSSNINRGYFQLSGNNVRMGTNSGNSTGNLVIRMNGNDRVTIDPSGNIDIDGKITRSAKTGVNSLLPVCYGLVKDDGTVLSGSGNFSVVRTSLGHYTITSNDFSTLAVFIATSATGADWTIAGASSSATTIYVEVRSHSAGNWSDSYFSFLVYKPG